jgi:hypothetical protein
MCAATEGIAWVLDSHLTSPDVRRALLNEARDQLKIARMLPKGEFYKQGHAIIDVLLNESAISYPAYWAIVGNDKIGEEMLQKNVFSHHFYADEITFQSTPMQRYCEQHWRQR